MDSLKSDQFIQILEFVQTTESSMSPTLKLNKSGLKSVLEQASNNRVALISIFSANNDNSQILLELLINGLERIENEKSMITAKTNDILQGLTYEGGNNQLAAGMYIWSRPYFLTNNGTKVAVFLFDIRSYTENSMSYNQFEFLLGIALSSFSSTILTSVGKLDEKNISSLQHYISYASLLEDTLNHNLDGIHPTSVFQNLMFLIQEWRTPSKYSCGFTGGEQFFEEKLNRIPNSCSTQNERKQIKKCFDDITCFLLPKAGNQDFPRPYPINLSTITVPFIQYSNQLLLSLISPEDLPIKSILGTELAVKDIPGCIDRYVKLFNQSCPPGTDTLMTTTVAIWNHNLINQFKERYILIMTKRQQKVPVSSNYNLDEFHQKTMKSVTHEFRKTPKHTNPDIVQSFEQDLINEIEEEFEKIKSVNEQNKSRLFEETLTNTIVSYKESIAEEFVNEEDFFPENELTQLTSSVLQLTLNEFRNKLFDQTSHEIEVSENTLLQTIRQANIQTLKENDRRKNLAAEKIEILLDQTVSAYELKMINHLEVNPSLDITEIIEFHHSNETEAIGNLKKHVNIKQNKLIYLNRLQNMLSGKFEKLQQRHIEKMERQHIEAEKYLGIALAKYQLDMSFKLKDLFEVEDFESQHETFKTAATSVIRANCPYAENSKLKDKYILNFDYSLQLKHNSLLEEFIKTKAECNSSYLDAMDQAFNLYLRNMEHLINSNKLFVEDEFLQKHSEIEINAMSNFNSFNTSKAHPKGYEYLKALRKKITTYFKISHENFLKHLELVQEKTKAASNCSFCDYQTEMLKSFSTACDESQLEELHNHAKYSALQNLKTNCPIKAADYTKPFIQNLEQQIMTTYNEDIKECFKPKMLERKQRTNVAITEARKYYHEEMNKHYKNTEFMKLDDLEKLHQRITFQATEICMNKSPLNNTQIQDFSNALQRTYIEEFRNVNLMNAPVNPAIGIDLGTTFSCVAVHWKGKTIVIPNAQGKLTTPSYVCYNEVGIVDCVGDPAKNRAYEHHENTVYDVKRILGRHFNDSTLQHDMKFWGFEVFEEAEIPKIRINEKVFYPEQISSEVLKEMRKIAEEYLTCEVKNAVITVPAYFNDGQKQATIDAGVIAGLNVLKILTEPTAAAIAYKLQHTDDFSRHAVVFDLGGGTFDVAVLKLEKGSIEVLAVDGDTHMGGEDVDQNLMQYCAAEFENLHGINLLDGKDSMDFQIKHSARKSIKRLQLECERKKIELSACRKVNISVDAIWAEETTVLDLKIPLTRYQFEELNEDIFERTMMILDRVLKNASIHKSQIKDIIPVGGSTRIPKIQELLTDFFDGKALTKTINPDEAVAYGAAVQAAILNGQLASGCTEGGLKLQEVTPKTLGVEVFGGDFSSIIMKNEKIPTTISEQYRTAHDNQTSVQITIYQGEDSLSKNNEWLGEFYLNGIPPGRAGKETIDVTMEIDYQGILHVTAVGTNTGIASSITVKEHKRRMGKEAIKRILDEAKAVPT